MLPHPPRRSLDVEDHGVVHEPVQDGGGNDRVAEDLAPLGQAPVGGDEGGVAPLIAGVDHVEEDPGSAPFDGEEPDVVDDQHARGGEGLELGGQGAFPLGLAPRC